MYKVVIPFRIQKKIKRFPKKDFERVKKAISSLASSPYVGKKLRGRYAGKYSLRIWPYRIIYTIKRQRLIIEVIEVEHRSRAYKE